MVLYFFVPSVMLFLNKRQRAWVSVALVAVLVALDSAINLGSIDDCVQGGEDARCSPLLVSRTFGIVLAALSGTIVHLERTMSRPVFWSLSGTTWVGFIVGMLWLDMSQSLNSEVANLPTLRLIGYPFGIVQSSKCIAQIIFEEARSPVETGLVEDAVIVEKTDGEEAEIEADACEAKMPL